MKNGPYALVIPPEKYPGKRYRGRYAYEHHVVWWKNTGEILTPGEEIHHKNEQKRDNRFENLEKLAAKEHQEYHGHKRSQDAIVEYQCGYCGRKNTLKGSVYRIRIKTNKYNKVFCNRVCGAKHQHNNPVECVK